MLITEIEKCPLIGICCIPLEVSQRASQADWPYAPTKFLAWKHMKERTWFGTKRVALPFDWNNLMILKWHNLVELCRNYLTEQHAQVETSQTQLHFLFNSHPWSFGSCCHFPAPFFSHPLSIVLFSIASSVLMLFFFSNFSRAWLHMWKHRAAVKVCERACVCVRVGGSWVWSLIPTTSVLLRPETPIHSHCAHLVQTVQNENPWDS